jgi:hypothetical protein
MIAMRMGDDGGDPNRDNGTNEHGSFFFAFPGRLIALFSKYSLYFKIVVLIEILIYIGSSILFKKISHILSHS